MESPTQPVPVPAPGGPTDPLVGHLVDGRYQVTARLARGGMATVYQATDTRLDRTVALKVMTPSLAEDPDFVARFRREARAAAQLSHPNVVAVYDQGTADGLPYLAMEFVPGRTLRDVLREFGDLSPEQALTILDPVLEALAAAHDAGFVHRDVKPENVLISDDGRVKVTDFGLARAVTNVTAATQGMLIGTVAYLSPEHVERGEADARSDVYGAGICLFEMLTGKVPYGGESPLSVAYQHVNTDVPAPSTVRAGIPPEVDALVATATRRDPAARYPDCRAFLADVRRVRRTLPTPVPLTPIAPAAHDTLVVGDELALAAAAGVVPPARVVAGPPPGARPPDISSAPPPKRRKRGWLIALIVLLLLAVAGAAAAGWYLAAGPGKSVAVPGIVGVDQATAKASLAKVNLNLKVNDTVYSETVPQDLIISADPAPGAQVKTGSTVGVVISLGPERYAVPVVRGLTVAAATDLLTQSHLAAGEVTEEWDTVARAGTIVSSDPAEGTELKPDTVVNLVVSKGPKPVKIPDVSGSSYDEAKATLEALGLTVTKAEDYSNDFSEGQVVSSTPEPGTKVDVGTSVELLVSKGPPPVEVPYLIDMFKEDAIALIESLGLVADVQESVVTPLNRVISQSPDSGTLVPQGSTITITII